MKDAYLVVARQKTQNCLQSFGRKTARKWTIEKMGVDGKTVWATFMWLRLGTSGGLLLTR